MNWPTVDDVRDAAVRLRGLAHRTALVPSFSSSTPSRDVRLKLESTQDTRSFKIRGAANAIIARANGTAGVVTYSTGNHGRATAYVAARLGMSAVVCVSNNTTDDKRQALTALGADVRVVGESQDAAATEARRLAEETGFILIDPINDPLVTAGHATIGLELLDQWPELDTVVVPVSGGALISGIALVMKELGTGIRVVGVSMERGAAMVESQRAGRPVVVDEVASLADSLQGGITLGNTHTFAMVRDLVDELVTVSEEEIAVAMVTALARERLVLEGAAATPLAVVASNRAGLGERVVLVATGAMVDVATLTGLVSPRVRGD